MRWIFLKILGPAVLLFRLFRLLFWLLFCCEPSAVFEARSRKNVRLHKPEGYANTAPIVQHAAEYQELLRGSQDGHHKS